MKRTSLSLCFFLALCPAVQAHAESINRETPLYHDSTDNSAAMVEAQKEHILKMENKAQILEDEKLELAALERLALINGTGSSEYRMALIRHKIKLGGNQRKEAKKLIEEFCSTQKDSYECIQSSALYEETTPSMRLKLKSFYMYHTNRDYIKAVEAIDEIYHGIPPVEHELAMQYYSMMGNIEGRENEALRELGRIYEEEPENSPLKIKIKSLLTELTTNYKAEAAINDLKKPKHRRSAIARLNAMIKENPDHPDVQYWKKRVMQSRYYDLLDEADLAHSKGQDQRAISLYKKAALLDSTSPYAYTGLAQIYSNLGWEKEFNLAKQKAVSASRGQSYAERVRIINSLKSRYADMLIKKAELEESRGLYQKSISLRKKALALSSDRPWEYYHIASLYSDMGEKDKARAVFDLLPLQRKTNADYAYPYALTLKSLDLNQEALSVISQVKRPDGRLKDLEKSIYEEELNDRIDSLVKLREYDRALNLADRLSKGPKHLKKSEIYDSMQRYDMALYELDSVQDLSPDENEYTLKKAGLLLKTENRNEAMGFLDRLYDNSASLSPSQKEELVELLENSGEYDKALKVNLEVIDGYEKNLEEKHKALPEEIHKNNAPLDILNQNKLYTDSKNTEAARDTAKALRTQGIISENAGEDPKNTLSYYNRSLSLLNGETGPYRDNAAFTDALRTSDEESNDWLLDSVKSRASKVYQRNNIIFTDGIIYNFDRGHPGYSDNRVLTNIANLSFPLFEGRGFIQADSISFRAGTLKNTPYSDSFGTCAVNDEGICHDYSPQKRRLTTFAIGYDTDRLHFDIGNGPKIKNNSYTIRDITGGLSYKFDFGDRLTITPEIHRRAKDSSLLAYAGQRAPVTGIAYGSVKKTGATVSLSYYINADQGLWGFVTQNLISGTKVKTNHELMLMSGYYHHLLNRPNEQFTLSPSLMYWQFDNDQSDYTLGNGGYYSPQHYYAAALSAAYKYRNSKVSMLLEGSVSLSHSKTESSEYYKTASAREEVLKRDSSEEAMSRTKGKSSNGVGLGGRVAVEYRLTPKFVIGSMFSASHSDDYSPLTYMLYFRTYFDDWNGDLPMPPNPPKPMTSW